ncbi:hypothetical protein K438DRAFT_1780260 [Mycena galopus ATCC 62051]|nr:hypothetical protein K438DRAFT_1780260 [Mycena galopus ATCC 62051]
MTGNLTKDKEEMAARAPQAAINGHLASAASAMQPSLRRGEGSVWQHSAYRMGSNGERALRPRLGGRMMRTRQPKQTRSPGAAWLSETFSGSTVPQRLATSTPHRLPHSVYKGGTLSRLNRAQAHLYSPHQNSGSSAVALASPEVDAVSPFKFFVPSIRAHLHPHPRPRLELKTQA